MPAHTMPARTTPPPRQRPAPRALPPPVQLAKPGKAVGFRTPLGPRRMKANEPAMRFASLTSAACRKEVVARKLPVSFDKKGYGKVGLPVRITGPMHGVTIRTAPKSSKYGVLDCRLALAFELMAEVLAQHGVRELRIGNIYRPGAQIRGQRTKSQHSHALAADVSAFVNAKGKVIPVEGNWGAAIRDLPCGPKAVMKSKSADARLLRDAVCDLSRRGVFHHILTPSANHDHRNHFHFDIARKSKNRFMK
jgi:hypothetical protein